MGRGRTADEFIVTVWFQVASDAAWERCCSPVVTASTAEEAEGKVRACEAIIRQQSMWRIHSLRYETQSLDGLRGVYGTLRRALLHPELQIRLPGYPRAE